MDIGCVQTMKFAKQRGRDAPPAMVIGIGENILGGVNEPKEERGDSRLPRRPRQIWKERDIPTHNFDFRGLNGQLHIVPGAQFSKDHNSGQCWTLSVSNVTFSHVHMY